MGEKFAANPVTGTGSISVPIAISPGRSGFGPQLSLSYDSGAGNGPFGFGWSLSLPSITRKTDKGLPRYQDGQEQEPDSDVFILSGAEDLVPVYRQDSDGSWVAAHPGYQRDPSGFWVRDPTGHLVIHEDERDGYRVRRYLPRIEGLFARIERWSKVGAPNNVHWRSISKGNILTVYGFDDTSRIADPLDSSLIFSWLICETRDDKGNGVRYVYKKEDGAYQLRSGQSEPFTQAHQLHRGQASDPRRTAQRYLQRVLYGNLKPLLNDKGQRPRFPSDLPNPPTNTGADWLFEVRFDYGELDKGDPTGQPEKPWFYRPDAFSSYRSGFEVRTCRRCERVLMLHHIPDQAAGPDRAPQPGYRGVVRSTDFTYDDELVFSLATKPIYSFLKQVVQTGWKQESGSTTRRSLPPVEFEYTKPIVQETVEEVDPESLENLPIGVDGTAYQWTDLHGEGIPGILSEQAGAWFYKRNWSPIPDKLPDGSEVVKAKFAAIETVALKPNVALSSGAQFMDLAGDGQPDLVTLDGPLPGLYEHDLEEGWEPFRPFRSRLNRDMRDPNLKFVDLDGDGHADVLITEDDAFVWHASLAEEGFGPAHRVTQPRDEEKGPRVVFADGTQSIYLADLSGDGLTDLVRIRNGEVCYWPNLGYGRFGAKVTMDHAPWFDNPDQFDHKRIRLADIDGSGTTDILYLHRDGVRLFFNQSGNSWSQPHQLKIFPRVDDVVSIVPTDLLGNGTVCLVWSSPLPGDARRPMRYVNLMGGQKPHLLVKTINNLGAETRVDYASSTKFYLQDKRDGQPWITRLPFPVHVVERVETYDHISRNRFVTRYAYHHGYFDGEEREFRGFGMVEQWDTEQIGALTTSGEFPQGDNIAAASHVPPVHTKTWFHTGVYDETDEVSQHFATEYYGAPEKSNSNYEALFDVYFKTLLPDTVIPSGMTWEEEREACRALKGSMLRQEVYADDAEYPGATPMQVQRARTPYTVTEQNYTIRALQKRGANRHAVFFTHAREAITYHYERNPADPRMQQALTLEVDAFGNVLKQAAIGYGRRASPLAEQWDRDRQTTALLTFTENSVTNTITTPDTHRSPLPCETITYELTGYTRTGTAGRYQASDFVAPDPAAPGRLRHRFTSPEVAYEATTTGSERRRPVEWLRTLYRRDDLGSLLPLGEMQPLALPGESYKLAFTPGLLTQVFQRPRPGQAAEPLLPDPPAVLSGQAGNRGGYLQSQMLKADGRFPASDAADYWWIPSGQSFFSPNPADSAATESTQARQHFFLPRRYRDPFGQDLFIEFDAHDLLMKESRDALGNRVTVDRNDYRVLQPRLVSDPNRNQTEVAFDTLGMVVGTAVMGKPSPAPVEGDSVTGFVADLTQTQVDDFIVQPRQPHPTKSESEAMPIVHTLLGMATTRIVYDLDRFRRARKANPNDSDKWEPPFAATIARETHVSDLGQNQKSKLQISFSYSDGFGREIQKKIQAEPGPIIDGGPIVNPRWVGSGWSIFNNKGKPVRQYEPFFTATHDFEFGVMAGVSPVLFYDPAERVIATLHPNHTYEKVVFDPWRQTTYDVNDTCAPRNQQTGDPRTDPDIGGYVAEYFKTQPATWQTWHAQRIGGALGQDERNAAQRAAVHADTPATAHFDALGRPFLTVARNRVVCPGHNLDGTEESFDTRVELDIEGNQRSVRDAIVQAGDPLGRIVMRYAYDMLGNRIHQFSMEAGARWMVNDVAGKPIHAWDSRGHNFTTKYDPLRRPTETRIKGGDGPAPLDNVYEKIIYGEDQSLNGKTDQELNLRGKPFTHYDTAGKVGFEEYDFKGNLRKSRRWLAKNYKGTPDWGIVDPNSLLEPEDFPEETEYDALNRPVAMITPDNSVIRPGYNEANLLERVDANLRGQTSANGQPMWTPFVTNIDYDAKGQRTGIDYGTRDGKGIMTSYAYDPDTFRLIHLQTRRNAAAFDGTDRPGEVQNLHYAYDPAGNITHIRDDAQQTIYFKGQIIEPSNDYTYDAVYRLIQASGREHLGQGGASIPHSHNDAGRVGVLSADAAGLFAPNDRNAMDRYCEKYVYDEVGNFKEMSHHRSCPAAPSWTRTYAYDEPSLIEANKRNNRLSKAPLQSDPPSATKDFGYDAHGNMTRMPHLPLMRWDYRDQLMATAQQVVNNGMPETTWYTYDASGQRVRKVTESMVSAQDAANERQPVRLKERIYLGGFEIYREYENDGVTPKLERETLHVMDDKQRIALVETKTIDTQSPVLSPQPLIRYQMSNHLGSASLELDDQAQIISYEEYAPYGSSTYQAVRSQTETAKRYRYTGKERDEESGLYYHGARYYAPWIGRWISCDPIGVKSGQIDLYVYARSNPIIFYDPTGGEEQVSGLVRYHQRLSLASEIIAGDFHEGDTTWTGTGANVVIGLIPGVGQLADARDTAAAIKNLWTKPSWGNAGMLGLAVVGWVPLFGDVAKGATKVGKKVVSASADVVEKVGKEAAGDVVEKVGKEGTQSVEKGAVNAAEKADDDAFDKTFKGGKDEAAYDTTDRLKRGNLGEKLATDALAAEGHSILHFKPSILGTNQGGIDMVTIKDGVVHFIDNKALTRTGNVSSVSALTTNFAKNKDTVLAELKDQLAKGGTKEQMDVLQNAVTAIEKGNFKKVVTNANLTKDDAILSGVSQGLRDEGFEFIDVFKPLGRK